MACLHGDEKLKDAIEKQNEKKVWQLLEDGTDPNALFHDDDIAPIHLGTGINKSITHLLIKYGGDPNLRTQEGVTPLHIAATWGNTDTLKLLLKNGGDINLRDDDGNTALDMAEKYAHEDCVRILRRHSQKMASKFDSHLRRQLKHCCSLNEKSQQTSSRFVPQVSTENFDASRYLTADSDPEESRTKPKFSILKTTSNGLVHSNKGKQCVLRKSASTESSEEKYIQSTSRYRSSNQPVPIPRRRTGHVAHPPQTFNDIVGVKQNGLEMNSEIFLTPAASSPRRLRHRPSRRYHSDDSPNVSSLEQLSSSEDEFISSTNTTTTTTATTDSDLYITVNETPQKTVFPNVIAPPSDLSIDLQKKMEKLQSLKIPIAQKIEQLRNCLNKLENNQLSASLEQILHESLTNESKPVIASIMRESYPPSRGNYGLLNSRHREGRAQCTHSVHKRAVPSNDVDIKLVMDIPAGKIYLNEKNVKKSKHRGHQTYEIHLDSSESTEKSSSRSKDDSVIDIKVNPKKKSHKKTYMVNPANSCEFPAKHERFQYVNREYYDKTKSGPCEASSHKRQFGKAEDDNKHKSNNPRVYNPAAHCMAYSSGQTHQNGWVRGRYTDDRCDRIVAGTSSCLYQDKPGGNADDKCNRIVTGTSGCVYQDKPGGNADDRCNRIVTGTSDCVYQDKPGGNVEKTSCNRIKQRQGLSRVVEKGHPPTQLYPKLTALTDNGDEFCGNRNSNDKQFILHQQQQNHSRRPHYDDAAIEETMVKQVYQPSVPRQQIVQAKRTQEIRRPDSQILTHEEVLKQNACVNKISNGNKNFRFGGRVVQKLCHKDTAVKTTVPTVKNTPLKPETADCKLYMVDRLSENIVVRRTISNVSTATTDTYVTCRTLDSEENEQFYSCDDGTWEKNADVTSGSKFESALVSISNCLKKQFEQSNSQDSSCFQDLRFDSEELSKAMSEMNLKEINDASDVPDGIYLSMLSQIEDQIVVTEQHSRQQPGSLYTSLFENVNSPNNSCYISSSEQCRPAFEEPLLPVKSKSNFGSPPPRNDIYRDSASPELKCYEPDETQYNSALMPRESDEDSLYLVCTQSISNVPPFQSFDEPDSKHLQPKDPKLLPKPTSQHQKYSANITKTSNETENVKSSHSAQFSDVMAELQNKLTRNTSVNQSKSFYRWQPPESVLKMKPNINYSANKAVGLGSVLKSSAHQENLKRNVGLELINHPLLKKLNQSKDDVGNSRHFYSCEISEDVNCDCDIVSEPIISQSNYLPPTVEKISPQSQFISFKENRKLKCKASHKQEGPVDSHSHYKSVQEEDGLDYSHYASVRAGGEEEDDDVNSHYISVRGEAGEEEEDNSHYISVRGRLVKSADSRYLSVSEENEPVDSSYKPVRDETRPFTSRSHYMSVREETETPPSKSFSILTENQNSVVSCQSHFLSAQEDGLGISKVSHMHQRGKSILQRGNSGHKLHSTSQHEAVTLKTRCMSPPENCVDQTRYESVQDRIKPVEGDQNSSHCIKNQNSQQSTEDDAPENSQYHSALDKSAINSQWQYISTSNGIHNRSVTWQNPISTYDETDAVVVVSTDDSLSWGPGKNSGRPLTITPFTSTASEDITSESTSSDGLKKCLANKEFLSPEKRTSMWVEGHYKIEEYFDNNISSIHPVVTSQSSSSDNVNNHKRFAANANNRIEPSAPPKSEVFSEFATADSEPDTNADISIDAVAGTPGEKSDPLTSSSRSPQRSSLYPSLRDPPLNRASSPIKEGKEPMIQNRLANESSMCMSVEERHTVNVESSVNFNNNANDNDQIGFVGNKTAMCAINVLPSVSSAGVGEQELRNNNPEVMNLKASKNISTQTPILRIPPSPPVKKSNPHLSKSPHELKHSTSPKRFEKLRKTITNLRKLLPGGKLQRKPGEKSFISVDRSHKFFSSNRGRSVSKTGTSGTQTDAPVYYEPTLQTVQVSKSDELSLSVNFSERLSDYSEKYPGSIINSPKRPTHSDSLNICSSSFLTPTEKVEAAVGFDEVDFIMPILPVADMVKATVQYGETYRSCIKLPDAYDKDIKFIHIDPERRINFIERRISVEDPKSNHSDDSEDAEKSFSKSPEETCSDCSGELFWKSCSKVKKGNTLTDATLKKLQSFLKRHSSFTDADLQKIFLDYGLPIPGPITSTTREMYINRLRAIVNGTVPDKGLPSPDYPITLRRALREPIDWTKTAEMEQKMVEKFESPKYIQKRKGGNFKYYFTYLLLDPRVTKNLPLRASKIADNSEMFRTFIQAIFYVGKGTRHRPYSHLYDALKRLNSKETKNDEKLFHITDIWNDGLGVISLHCFQGVTADEAYSREACIIDAIGLANLTNKMRGSSYGLTVKWSPACKREMGTYLLYKAFQIFLAEGERQIYPIDLDSKS